MNRIAIKFGYLGSDFHGYVFDEHHETVEGEILKRLIKYNVISSKKENRFVSASRTDRSVSAVGHVVAFDTSFNAEPVLRILNSTKKMVFFYGWKYVSENFNPRKALSRVYRYYLPLTENTNIEKLEKAASLFLGEHDFKYFCSDSNNQTNTIREIKKIDIQITDKFAIIDITAQSFLYHMVRKIVSAIQRVAESKNSYEDIIATLNKNRSNTFGMANPENLILMGVNYSFEFEVYESLNLRLMEKLQSQLHKTYVLQNFLKSVVEASQVVSRKS